MAFIEVTKNYSEHTRIYPNVKGNKWILLFIVEVINFIHNLDNLQKRWKTNKLQKYDLFCTCIY